MVRTRNYQALSYHCSDDGTMARATLPVVVTQPDPATVEIDRLRELLSLVPHPEGGYYSEHYRGPSPSPLSTAIYYLMPQGTFSAWHRVTQDELWHHYQGGLVELHTLDETLGYRVQLLGALEPRSNEDVRPCCLVPGGVWQAARPIGAYALVGNTVSPAFEFADWSLADLPTRLRLADAFPAARSALIQLAR
jgi:predicted cupin superfamily sugar epimerase